MRRLGLMLPLLAACWGTNAYIVEGRVVEVRAPNEIVLDHQEVPGLMPEMVMPFTVKDPTLLQGLEPGDAVYARLIAADEAQGGWYLAELREHNKPGARTPAPEAADDKSDDDKAASKTSAPPLRPGKTLPTTSLPLADGSTLTVGQGQSGPVLLTFIYTTCPRPDFCPAITSRLQALQAELEPGQATLVSVTIDPENDTPQVLQAYARDAGADPKIWRFARVEGPALTTLAQRAALTIDAGSGEEILHSLRTWVLDDQGRLIERYDDARFPQDRVLQQLRTGGPAAPEGSDGTVTRPADHDSDKP